MTFATLTFMDSIRAVSLAGLLLVSAMPACIDVSAPRIYGTGGGDAQTGGGLGVGAGGVGGAGGAPSALPVCDGMVTRPCASLVHMAAGGTFSCARFDDDTVRCWGGNDVGQLGVRALPSSVYEDVIVTDLPPFDEMSLGWAHGCGIYQGDVWCWGGNLANQLGGPGAGGPEPRALGLNGATDVDVDWDGACAVWGTPSNVSCWGTLLDGDSWIGHNLNPSYPSPRVVGGLEAEIPVEVTVGSRHACAATADDAVWCWGDDAWGKLGQAGTGDSVLALEADNLLAPFTHLGSGSKHNCVVTGNPSSLLCWGYLPYQQEVVPTPLLNWDGAGVVKMTHFRDGFCAAYASGIVKCTGDNEYGQVPPNHHSVSVVEPMVQVPGLGDVVQVEAGVAHICAVKSSGAVWCWGRNSEGQLGLGGRTLREPPVQVVLNP